MEEGGKPSVVIREGAVAARAFRGMRRAVAAMAALGNDMIVDDVLLGDSGADYAALLAPYRLYRVGVFAPLEQTSVGLETRLNLTFSPALSLETYLQPLLSSADYGDATQLVAPKSYEFSPYAGQVPDLDFNLRSLRGNAVLRWEWREGSTVYFAWQQSRSDLAAVGDFDFGRDRRALFGARPDNIFLVKANFWVNP